MNKRLKIELSPSATEKYLELSSKQVKVEVNDEILPCGVDIRIEIAPLPFDSIAYYREHELGLCEVTLI